MSLQRKTPSCRASWRQPWCSPNRLPHSVPPFRTHLCGIPQFVPGLPSFFPLSWSEAAAHGHMGHSDEAASSPGLVLSNYYASQSVDTAVDQADASAAADLSAPLLNPPPTTDPAVATSLPLLDNTVGVVSESSSHPKRSSSCRSLLKDSVIRHSSTGTKEQLASPGLRRRPASTVQLLCIHKGAPG